VYVRASITIGDDETEFTGTCEYKESNWGGIGGCLAEAFVKADCTLSTLADMMDALRNHDMFLLDNVDSVRIAQALRDLKGD